MSVQVELVSGANYSHQASVILRDAWAPPSIDYSDSYLAWQFGFPGAFGSPASFAHDGGEPVGFAGATSRRLRCSERYIDAVIVSFVAVRPSWRGQGVARRLYAALLGRLRQIASPIVTFAQQGSPGEKLLLAEYARAGFSVRRLDDYAGYAASIRDAASASAWTPAATRDGTLALEAVAEQCAADPTLAWSAPTVEQLRHYSQDERPRTLFLAGGASSPLASAFVVEAPYRTARGLEQILIADTLWADRRRPEAVSGLVPAIARELRATSTPTHAVVSFPSLSGFAAESLRASGIRRTGPAYSSYVCYAGERDPFSGVRALNLELV